MLTYDETIELLDKYDLTYYEELYCEDLVIIVYIEENDNENSNNFWEIVKERNVEDFGDNTYLLDYEDLYLEIR